MKYQKLYQIHAIDILTTWHRDESTFIKSQEDVFSVELDRN